MKGDRWWGRGRGDEESLAHGLLVSQQLDSERNFKRKVMAYIHIQYSLSLGHSDFLIIKMLCCPYMYHICVFSGYQIRISILYEFPKLIEVSAIVYSPVLRRCSQRGKGSGDN